MQLAGARVADLVAWRIQLVEAEIETAEHVVRLIAPLLVDNGMVAHMTPLAVADAGAVKPVAQLAQSVLVAAIVMAARRILAAVPATAAAVEGKHKIQTFLGIVAPLT